MTDVVDHLNSLGNDRVRLVALVSMRGFVRSYRSIRARVPDAIVLPIVPRSHRWRNSMAWVWLLCRILRPTGIMGRGVFATALALRMRDSGLIASVCFDARAAYGAEWEEFRVVDDDDAISECAALEREAVGLSDVRISVSKALVEYWRGRYQYHGERHVVIPCTMSNSSPRSSGKRDPLTRSRLGWADEDLVLVYSGTASGWQSLELLQEVLVPWLARSVGHRCLFLCEPHEAIDRLERDFPGQVVRVWLPHEDVVPTLAMCDHGLLLREPCLTNQVASPTKFSEYLRAGLPVIISEGVGDLSDLVRKERSGVVLGKKAVITVERPDDVERERMKGVARSHFSKGSFNTAYGTVMSHLGADRKEWTTSRKDEQDMLVSIIVPSFNKRNFLELMWNSVRTQTDGRWELLVVDDASTDGSPELLRDLAGHDERVRIIVLPENAGANRCRNRGIQEARGAYVIFLDADDVLAAHCVAERIKVMNGSGLDLAVFTMQVFREQPGDSEHCWVPDTSRPLEAFLRHDLPWQTMQPIWDRDFLLRIGGFDEAFPRHQDVELHTRALMLEGVRYRLCPDPPDCHYRIADERKVLDPFDLLERFCRSAVMFRDKFHPQAEVRGKAELLLGIILRTHLQVLLNMKMDRITDTQVDDLEHILFDTGRTPISKSARRLFRFSRWYNTRALRIPGVNRLLFLALTVGPE